MWAIRRLRSHGYYILFRNHSTNEDTYVNSALRHILRPRLWPLLMLLVLLWSLALLDIPNGGPTFDLNVGISGSGAGVVKLTLIAIPSWLVMRPIVGRQGE